MGRKSRFSVYATNAVAKGQEADKHRNLPHICTDLHKIRDARIFRKNRTMEENGHTEPSSSDNCNDPGGFEPVVFAAKCSVT